MPKPVTTKAACLGPYSHAMKCKGELIFVSGQLGTVDGELAKTVEEQTKYALINLQSVLEAGNSSMDRVVKTSVYLKNMDDFAAVNKVYGEMFNGWKPARVCCQVAKLPKDALVEIECIAECKEE